MGGVYMDWLFFDDTTATASTSLWAHYAEDKYLMQDRSLF